MMFTLSLTDFKYAQRARTIVNRAVINEDPNAKIIRGLFYKMWMVYGIECSCVLSLFQYKCECCLACSSTSVGWAVRRARKK